MNSFTNDSNNNHVEIYHTPTKKRSKEGKEEKKSKKKKVKKDMIENVDVNVGNQAIRLWSWVTVSSIALSC